MQQNEKDRVNRHGTRYSVPGVAVFILCLNFPALANEAATAPIAPATSSPQAEPRFSIRDFQVDGNSLLEEREIFTLLNFYLGAERRFADIEAARRALEARYLSAGFSTVRVILPEQEISAGTIRLVVQEMKLGSLELTGAQHHDTDNVRNSLPGLTEGQVPNTTALAESLRLANENPSKQTHLLFKPDPAGQRVDAMLRLEDEKPWKTFLTADNTGTPETGRTRLGVGFQHANLFNRDHVGTVQYITSVEKPKEVSIYGFGYRVPLYDLANTIDLYGGYSHVNSGNLSGLFNVSGKGTIFGARYTHYFTKTSPFEHKLAFGLDYRAYQNDVIANGTQLGSDVTVHPFNLTWSTFWKGDTRQIGSYASWFRNISGGNNGRDSDFNATRLGADANYQLFRFGGSASQQFAGDWQFRLAFDAQHSSEPLVPGEQFAIGGQDSVRGFAEREVSGDKGWRSGIEVFTPDMGGLTGINDARLRFSTFFEGGETHRIQALPGEIENQHIASAGLGMRFGIGKSLSIRLDYGHVLDGGGTTEKHHGKLHGSVAYLF